MAHDLFLCYDLQDRAIADATCAFLEARNIRCWLAPRDIPPDHDSVTATMEALKESPLLVLVYSLHSNVSPHVKREVERAVNLGIPVLPLRIHDTPMSAHMEYFISTPHWLDALTAPVEQHLHRLVDAVSRLQQKAPQDRAPDAASVPAVSAASSAPPSPPAPAALATPALKLPLRDPRPCLANASAYNNRGQECLRKGEFPSAVLDFNAALRLNPKLTAALLNRGRTWEAAGDMQRAGADYDAALQLDPAYAQAYLCRSELLRKQGQIERADEDLRIAQSYNPQLGPKKESI